LLHAKPRLHPHANHAHKDHPDLLAHPDLLETQERLVPPADPDTMLLPEPPVPEDLPDQLEKPAPLDPLANLDNPPSASPSLPDPRENPEISDHPDLPVHLVNPVWMAHLDQPDPRENPEPLAPMEPTETPDLLDHPAPPERRERRVFARNTAPSTVVSSSKTELADKSINWVFVSSTSAHKHHFGRDEFFFHHKADIFNICWWSRVDDVLSTSSLYFHVYLSPFMLHFFVFTLFT
jgi:hypothetical protein